MSRVGSIASLLGSLLSTQLILLSACSYLGVTSSQQDWSWLVVTTEDHPSLKCWFNLETITVQFKEGAALTATYAAEDCGGTIMCSTCGGSFDNIVVFLTVAYFFGSLAMICSGLRVRSFNVQKQIDGNRNILFACVVCSVVYLALVVAAAVSLSVCSQTIHDVLQEHVSLSNGALVALAGAALMAAVAAENAFALVISGPQQA
jgi:hypothetical protein